MAEETEEFAELLRELKSRSGQSYAGLAKRLHMSTSTVHRYCNGDAVPAEYAPVERFARVCGAKPEELVELHRHWILADAARRRKAATSRAVAAPSATEGATEGAAEADASPVPGAPAQGAAATPVSSAAAGPSSGGAHPSRPAGRLPTTRLALIGAVVVAIAAASAAVVGYAASPGRGSAAHDDARRPQQAQSPTAPGRTSIPKPLLSSPSASPSGGTVAPAPDAPSEAPSEAPGPKAPSGGDSAPAAVPLTVSTRPYVWQDRCDQYYLTDRQPPFMPPPPEEQDAPGWAANLRAVAGGRTDVELSVQGKGREAVVLHALRVRVVKRSAPLSWNAYAMGSGCGGGLTPAFHDLDLDAGQPRVRAMGGMQGDIAIPATDFPYKVSSTDPQVLKVYARTESHDVSWYLELEWSSGDRHGTVRIDDHGRPFRTSAIKDRPQYFYWLGKNVWSPVEGENRSK
ncbi:helix-turn-helix domain-containing protein [Streptomyces sp. NPDC000405]|uniref:helix-turn-helix domain-containing protein n=1 Tax=Streptomyces sp. NPDC000405 TaxID=3161033 RepID=UPI00398C97E5